eukprot:CCRYP_020797-RA/>CCRYP_020797-RA protein AED:0.02 eAED:0.02 QI:63/1/1/1/1/1/4/190/880
MLVVWHHISSTIQSNARTTTTNSMKFLPPSLLLLLASAPIAIIAPAALGFSPPQTRRHSNSFRHPPPTISASASSRPSSRLIAQTRTTSTSSSGGRTTQEIKVSPESELEKRQRHKRSRQRWGKYMKFHAKPADVSRPFQDLSLEELRMLTDYHLGEAHAAAVADADHDDTSNHHGEKGEDGVSDAFSGRMMSSHHVHEITKLLSSWAKLAVVGYVPLKSGDTTGKDGVVMLNKKERTMAAEMAEKCLRQLVKQQKLGNEKAIVSVDLYHLVITAWVKSGSHADLVHATSLLDYMENNGHCNILSDGPKYNVTSSKSSAKCYVAVLDGWCKSPYRDAEIQAEAMLHRMDSLGIHNIKYYNNVMNRIAMSGKPNAGSEAERLLNELIEMYKNGNSTMSPDRNAFNTVIKAYANSGGKTGPRNAKRILGMMENPAKHGLEDIASDIEPDRVSCTSIMMAWANSNDDGGCEVDAGEKAEQLLERMEEVFAKKGGMKPDTATYNAVIKVWGKCGDNRAGQKSEELLRRMLQQYQNGTNHDAKPDDITFNSVIHNVATSLDIDSPQRALNILEQMEQYYEKGLIDAKPDIITYNSVLNSFAKSNRPGSAQQAEEILDNLEKSFDSGVWNIEPDVFSYNTVINAWSNSNDEYSAQRAVALLDRMSARAKKGKSKVKPDTKTYNTVLHAWSQSTDRNAPIKALGLLELMFRLYEKGDKNAQPDVLSFSTVINAFSKSRFPGRARECRNLLRRMKNLYDEGQENMRPNIFIYSAVLNACAYTFGRSDEKDEALNIGIETFEELKNSGIRPNHVAYGSFLRICRRLMAEDDPRRNHFITRAFKQCCADGQVGIYVLKQIRADPKLFVALLQAYIVDGDVQYHDVSSTTS